MIRICLLMLFIITAIYILKAFIKAQQKYEELLNDKSQILNTQFIKLRNQIFRRYIVKSILAMLIYVLIFALTGIIRWMLL